ncbi:MAG: sulfite exporter TauE/SafE family protein [Desulfovibrionaceae bacterium]
MYFPTAGIECHPLIPPLVALVVSFVTSMGGVSGAFLLLPFQMSFLGYTNPSVSATNQFYNVVAIPSGVYRFIKEGRMVWPLTCVVIIGTLPGVFIGALIRVNWLPDASNFKLFAAVVLLYIGGRMVRDLYAKAPVSGVQSAESRFQDLIKNFQHKAQTEGTALPRVRIVRWNSRLVEYEFYGEQFTFPVRGVFLLTFIVGIVGGVYGIGGGAIISPFFVSFFGLPVYTVAGAALMGTFITSVAGVLFYMLIAPYYPQLSVAPDWTLGLLLGIGGMCGMYLGARCQKFVPAKYIKIILAIILIGTSFQYTLQFFR